MRVSALAVNTNYQCRTRGLECFFFRDVILKSSAMAVDFDQLLPLMLFEVVLFILKCVGTLALLFAQPKTPGSFLLLPVQHQANLQLRRIFNRFSVFPHQ